MYQLVLSLAKILISNKPKSVRVNIELELPSEYTETLSALESKCTIPPM